MVKARQGGQRSGNAEATWIAGPHKALPIKKVLMINRRLPTEGQRRARCGGPDSARTLPAEEPRREGGGRGQGGGGDDVMAKRAL